MCPCLKFILVYVLSVGKVAKVAKVAGVMYGGGGGRGDTLVSCLGLR